VLIQRFIDPKARFVFGDAREGAVSFDMFDGDYTHEGDPLHVRNAAPALRVGTGRALRRDRRDGARRGMKGRKVRADETPGFERMIAASSSVTHATTPAVERGVELLKRPLRINTAVPTSAMTQS